MTTPIFTALDVLLYTLALGLGWWSITLSHAIKRETKLTNDLIDQYRKLAEQEQDDVLS